MSFSVSDTVSTAQADLEKLVTDLRGLLASKELDAVPDIHVLRQRLFQFGQTSAASGHLFGVVLLPVLDCILHPLRLAAIGGCLQLAQGADDLLEIATLEVTDATLNGLFEQLVAPGQQRAGFCLMGRRGQRSGLAQ